MSLSTLGTHITQNNEIQEELKTRIQAGNRLDAILD